MRSILQSIVTAWIGRHAAPEAKALADVAALRPAALITGASRGIGFALAQTFAEAGHNVVLVARDPAQLEAAARAISSRIAGPVTAVPLAVDVTDPDAPARIDAALRANGLYLDVLVNNAGMGLAGPFAENGVTALDRLTALNVGALTRLMRHAVPGMRARGRGGVLNIASLGGWVPGPNQAAYYASKAYVISLTEAVAAEVAGQGVRIAVVAPGPVETGFHSAMGAEQSPYRQLVPSLSPEHVARSAYRGFMLGRRVIVPGVLNNLAALALWIFPNAVLVPITGWLLSRRRDEG